MTTLANYSNTNHKQFTHELLKINGKLFIIYKNKGYTEKSTVYGSIYQISQGDNPMITFKTKKQVINYLTNQPS